MVFKLFEPFVEAPSIRTNLATATSGIDTSAIDGFRQGVSVKTNRHRYAGTLPKLGTGQDDSSLEILVFGQESEFEFNTKFEEILKFNPVAYINSVDALIFPVVVSNNSYRNQEKFGSFIEPLSLGPRSLFAGITSDRELNGIFGLIQDGNEDLFGKSDRIIQIIELPRRNYVSRLFFDSSERLEISGKTIGLPDIFVEQENVILPFDDSRFHNKSYIEKNTITGEDLISALVKTEGRATSRYIGFNEKSAGAGWTYDKSEFGTDSIAFGGRKR